MNYSCTRKSHVQYFTFYYLLVIPINYYNSIHHNIISLLIPLTLELNEKVLGTIFYK